MVVMSPAANASTARASIVKHRTAAAPDAALSAGRPGRVLGLRKAVQGRLTKPLSCRMGSRLMIFCSYSQPPAEAAAMLSNSTDDSSSQRQAWAATVHSTLAATVLSAAMLASAQPSIAATAAENFATKCVGCHVGGGNVVQAGATLQLDDLKKNGVDTPELIYDLIYKGKGKMPGFGIECAPKGQCTFTARLSDEEVQEMAAYILEQSSNGWPQ